MNLRDQRLEAPARRLINNFGALPEVEPHHVTTLTRVITESAHLIRQLNAAVASCGLRRFELFDPTDPSVSARGGYERGLRTIRIPAPVLDEPDETETAYLLGHGLQHALNSSAATGHHDHDAAAQLPDLLMVDRLEESRAAIAGWNALVDHLRALQPDLTLQEVYTASPDRADGFVIMEPSGIVAARPNLLINEDLTLDPSFRNLHGVAQNYTDRLPIPHAYGGYPQVGV